MNFMIFFSLANFMITEYYCLVKFWSHILEKNVGSGI